MSKQEAVAWRYKDYHDKWVLSDEWNQYYPKMKAEPLYTHPAPSWQGLSDDEISKLGWMDYMYENEQIELVREIEAKLKEKNGR